MVTMMMFCFLLSFYEISLGYVCIYGERGIIERSIGFSKGEVTGIEE